MEHVDVVVTEITPTEYIIIKGKRLLPENLHERFENNVLKYGIQKDHLSFSRFNTVNLDELIAYAFPWIRTPESSLFWQKVSNGIFNYKID